MSGVVPKSVANNRWKLWLAEANNMQYVLASDPFAPWGQVAAIVLLIYLMVFILIGLVLALVLMLGLTWVREKAELIKKLRPTVDSVNTTTEAALSGRL